MVIIFALAGPIMSFIQVLREVFGNRNIKILTVSQTPFMFIAFLWFPYRSLFILELGATTELLGILLMVETVAQIFFQLIGGIFADKFGRRRILVFSSIFRVVSPLVFIFSTHWTHIAPGLILQSVAMLGIPAMNALIAESLPQKTRGAGYATYRMVTWMPMIITSMLGGIIMDYFGIIQGMQICFVASMIVSIFSTFLRWRYLTETLNITIIPKERVKPKKRSIKNRLFHELSIISRTVWILIIVTALSSFAMRVVFSYIVVYSVDIIGLSKTEWGIIGTGVSVISTVLTLPVGILADRIGRKSCIIFSRILSLLSTLGYTFAINFWQIYLVRAIGGVAQGFGGLVMGVMGGPVWQALVADVTPAKQRGKIMGIMGTISGIASTPASWVGGFMYDNISPELPFQMSFIFDVIGTIIFIGFIKEPKKLE
jgi:MFS family permease